MEKVEKALNSVSPTFCLAKWLQVTIDLQHGTTHSCHLPIRHKVPLEELEKNPRALHNTLFKKEQRRMMLQGERPKECDYCWQVEDSPGQNRSDRLLKSAQSWAFERFADAVSAGHLGDINPTYVEVMFGNECQFTCLYCNSTISSAIASELQKDGPYPGRLQGYRVGDKHLFAVKGQVNPYIEAFWKWWPSLVPDLKVFRITGGEPLLNPNTFRVLDEFLETERPHLTLAINSNLGIPEKKFGEFLKKSQKLAREKKVAGLELFTSVDTYGEQAEYIRHGLCYQELMERCRIFLENVPGASLIFMVTFNLLSIPRFQFFLEDVGLRLKKTFGERVVVDISHLQWPHCLGLRLGGDREKESMEKAHAFMVKSGWSLEEETRMGRMLNLLETPLPEGEKTFLLQELGLFLREYDRRKGTSFPLVFPEFHSLIPYIC